MSNYKEFGQKICSGLSRFIHPPQAKPTYQIYRDIMTKSQIDHPENPEKGGK